MSTTGQKAFFNTYKVKYDKQNHKLSEGGSYRNEEGHLAYQETN